MSAPWVAVVPGTGSPKYDNAPVTYTPSLYADITAVLDGTLEAPQPTVGRREDGFNLFYPATTNGLVGAPESGKTLFALCVLADELFAGNRVLVIDVDHNGAAATVARLRSFGVSENTLKDPALFRYASPEDKDELLAVVNETHLWKPTAVLVDSVGEVLPMFGASSNNGDEYTAVHRQVFTALANSGASVVLIDHEPKSDGAAEYGAGGTMAKKRAIDGALYRVKVKQPFAPGAGGKAVLSILKDRHGAIRAASLVGVSSREPVAATFHLKAGEATHWTFYAPTEADNLKADKLAQDVATLEALHDPPVSVRDITKRTGIPKDRAMYALRAYKNKQESVGSVPVPLLKERGQRTTLTPSGEGHIRTVQGQGQGE